MFVTVKLKLPAKLQQRIARTAGTTRNAAHRWMLAALEREVERRERFLAFIGRARREEQATDPVSESHAREQFRLWLDQLSAGGKSPLLRPRRRRFSNRLRGI